MRTRLELWRRAAACVLAVTMTFATVPPVSAKEPVLGTVTVTGTAFGSTASSDWVKITKTRPLVGGDRLRTAGGAGLVADFGELGIIGLYGNSEMWITGAGSNLAVEAKQGKVAFHLSPRAKLKVTAAGASVSAGDRMAEGYVEFNAAGVPELVVESEDLTVTPAGGTTKIAARGEHILLVTSGQDVVATTDERKAGAVPATPTSTPSRKIRGGLSPWAWTAIGVAVVAAGVGAGVGLSGGGGGGGDDSNGSGD